MITQVFLDLDGVIIDYCGAVNRYFDLGLTEQDMTEYDTIERVYMEKTGDSRSRFWERQGEDFWMSLPMYPWAEELLEMLKPYRPTILTAPTLTNAGWRQAWIRHHMPKYFHRKRYLIGPDKAACAHDGALLIDDKPGNVEGFMRAGGHCILFPQPWNTGLYCLKRGRFEWFKEAFEFIEDDVGIDEKGGTRK